MPDALEARTLDWTAPFDLRRRGVEIRIVAGTLMPGPDRTLVRALARSHRWLAALRERRSLTDVARADGVTPAFVRSRLPLAFLAPAIQAAILDGRQPAKLSLARILRSGVPLDWDEQGRLWESGER